MSTQNFWHCLKALAADLDGSREHGEQILNELQEEILQWRETDRQDARRNMVLIVAQLSRLESRLKDLGDGRAPTL